jgi:hypothetical protein
MLLFWIPFFCMRWGRIEAQRSIMPTVITLDVNFLVFPSFVWDRVVFRLVLSIIQTTINNYCLQPFSHYSHLLNVVTVIQTTINNYCLQPFSHYSHLLNVVTDKR